MMIPAQWMVSFSSSMFASSLLFFTHDAAEAEVAGRGVHVLRHARRGAVALAVVRRAQVRAAFHDFARDALALRGAGIDAVFARAAARVGDRAAGLRDPAVVLVPVDGPLPHVAGHVVEAVAVRRERADRRGPLVAVL